MMNLHDFAAFMEQCHPLFDSVVFVGSGEPTMHPQFIEFVECASRYRKLTDVSTNGSIPLDPARLIQSGMDRISFDIEGLTQAQHEIYRVGSDLDAICNNIRNLLQERKARHSIFPEICMSTLISRHNEYDYDALIEMGRDLGVDAICFSTITDDLFKTTDWFPESEKFRHMKRDVPDECEFKHSTIGMLSYEGEIQLCCMTPHHDKPIIKAQAFQDDHILEVFDSEKFLNITRKSGTYPFCKDCFLVNYDVYYEKISFRNKRHRLIKTFQKHPQTMLSRMGAALTGRRVR